MNNATMLTSSDADQESRVAAAERKKLLAEYARLLGANDYRKASRLDELVKLLGIPRNQFLHGSLSAQIEAAGIIEVSHHQTSKGFNHHG